VFKKTYPIWLLGLLVVFLAFGCSDDDDETPTGTNGTPSMEHTPTPINVGVPEAMAQSNDPYAQMATDWVEALASFDSLFTYFIPPSKAAKAAISFVSAADTLVWSWSNGTMTIKLRFWESTTHYHWQYLWDGTLDQVVYDNWVWFYADESKDGTEGHFYWYDNNTTDILFSWTWTYLAGVYNVTYLFTSGLDSLRIAAIINADGSGHVDYYLNDVLSIRVVWYADGSGAWWTYNPDDNGTWSVVKN